LARAGARPPRPEPGRRRGPSSAAAAAAEQAESFDPEIPGYHDS
jgi:hypothetical protein